METLLAHFRMLSVQSKDDALILGCPRGRISEANARAAEMFGYQTMEGMPIYELMPKKYRESHIKGLERLAKGGASNVAGSEMAVYGLHSSGREFRIYLTVRHFPIQGDVWSIGSIRRRSMIPPQVHRAVSVMLMVCAIVLGIGVVRNSIWLYYSEEDRERLQRTMGMVRDDIVGVHDVVSEIQTAPEVATFQGLASRLDVIEAKLDLTLKRLKPYDP